jgi:hypothetical protein
MPMRLLLTIVLSSPILTLGHSAYAYDTTTNATEELYYASSSESSGTCYGMARMVQRGSRLRLDAKLIQFPCITPNQGIPSHIYERVQSWVNSQNWSLVDFNPMEESRALEHDSYDRVIDIRNLESSL